MTAPTKNSRRTHLEVRAERAIQALRALNPDDLADFAQEFVVQAPLTAKILAPELSKYVESHGKTL